MLLLNALYIYSWASSLGNCKQRSHEPQRAGQGDQGQSRAGAKAGQQLVPWDFTSAHLLSHKINKQTNKCRLIERSRLQVINNCSFFFPTLNRTWRSLPRQISYLGLGGSPSSIFLRKTYKAQFLAASPGHCPGPLAASSHHAKSIPGSRRSGRIMRSLRELPTWQQPFHQKSPCCNQRRSFLFILRELTGKWSGPNFVQKMGATNEVLPLAFFFLFYSAQETYIFLQLFIQGWQSPQSGILKRWQKTRYASPVLSPFPHSFQIFFPFQGQKSLLMFWIKCLDI